MSEAGQQFDPDVVAAFIRIGDDDLENVRGWSATVAGIAVGGSQIASIGSRLATVFATVAGVGVATSATVTTLPPAIAFERPVTTTTTTTTTTTEPPTTTTTEPPTTTTTSTTTTTTTTTIAPRLVSLTYEIGSNQIDGVEVQLGQVDMLEVFIEGELDQTIELTEDQRICLLYTSPSPRDRG